MVSDLSTLNSRYLLIVYRKTILQCKSLLTMYQSILKVGKVDRMRFREILHSAFDITDDVMLDRVYRVFDKDNDGLVQTNFFLPI
jgi:Ca2+-binding EF-hand superfamily protein